MASVLTGLELSDTFDGWKTKINANELALESKIDADVAALESSVETDMSSLESRLTALIAEQSIQMSIVLGS